MANTILSSEYSIVRAVSLHIWSWRTYLIQISATEINHYDSLCAISLYFSDLARALIIQVVKSFKSKQYIKPQPHLNIKTSWPYSDDKVAPWKWHHDVIWYYDMRMCENICFSSNFDQTSLSCTGYGYTVTNSLWLLYDPLR